MKDKTEVKMKKLIFVLLLVLSVTVTGTILNATPAPYLQRHMQFGNNMALKNFYAGKFLIRLKDQIGLNTEQVAKIEKMNLSFQESVIKTTADLKLTELRFANYLRSDKVNRKQAENMLRSIAKIKTGMQVNRLNYMLDLRDILTPEQRLKVQNLKKKAGMMMRRRSKGMRTSKRGRPQINRK